MKLGFKDRMKVLATGSISEYAKGFYGGDTLPGDTSVDGETALKYSAVFSCCRVLGETFPSAPLILYKKDGKERIPVTELPKPDERAALLHDIMHNTPNEEMSAFNSNEAQSYALNLGGNAVCEKLFNKDGVLVGIYPYPYTMVEIERNKETKRLEYTIGTGNDKKTLDRSKVLHVPGPSLDGVKGLSPISYAAGSIALGRSYETFGRKFYENSANPSGVFETEGHLSPESATRLRSDLKTNWQGLKNTGTPMVLEDGMKWHQMTINPIDAQLIESKYFQIEDICRIYRVPQHLVNKLDRSTNNNIEHQSLEFIMYTMLPFYKRFEGCHNAQLVPQALRLQGYFFEYKMDGLLRGDSAARSALYANGRMWGWLSANDIRKLENLPSLGPEGDIYLQPANYLKAGSEQTQNVYANMIDEIYKMIEERRSA